MKAPLGLLVFFLALPPLATAADPDANPGFPTAPPVRERVFAVDDHAPWTLRKGEAAVPLVVVPVLGRTAVALAGGWVLLGPDLDILPSSVDFLAAGQPAGTPWAQTVNGVLVFVSSSPGDLVVLYPDTAVTFRQRIDLADLSFFSATDQGFVFVQGRRVWQTSRWGKEIREVQPLPFFPSDVEAAPDGTAWASDSLQARPWRQEEPFWKPLELPKSPGRLTSISPFPDSTGYVAGGPGWVGSFSSDGTPFWVRDKDLSGKPLPQDIRVRAGDGRVYLWSAQARKVWSWGWNVGGPQGPVAAPSLDEVADLVRTEIQRLEVKGSVPEAQAVAQYGVELGQTILRTVPFTANWTQAVAEFAVKRQSLRERVIGVGVFSLSWDLPFGKPLATWTWEPDASASDVKAWRVTTKPFWEGRAYDTDDFKLAKAATRAPWPEVSRLRQGDLVLPSWMNLDLRPEGTDDPVHWTRIVLPAPPVPYDLPVE